MACGWARSSSDVADDFDVDWLLYRTNRSRFSQRSGCFKLCAPFATKVDVVSSDLGDIIPSAMSDGVPTGLALTRDAAVRGLIDGRKLF